MECITAAPKLTTKDIITNTKLFQHSQISITPATLINMLTYCKIKVPTAAIEHLSQVNKNGTVSMNVFNKQYMTSLTNAIFKLKNYRA